ncbi:Conserved oligomeric Golgi complex subunit 6 [Gryllus bimaculatus]|nr:Conserved oligomeric Golgi complex subunit 6 [Gryllus bimaculatus]
MTNDANNTQPSNAVGKKNDQVLSRRLNKILETRLENDKDTIEALKELSTFFSENTLQTRRNLRSKIEKRSLAINEDFLSAFREVKEVLDGIYDDVIAMNNSVLNMTGRLHATKTKTYQLIDQTTKLQAESQKITLQQDIAEAFLKRFQLTSSEQSVLRSSHNLSVTGEFFTILDRVQNIHSNCHMLMQSGHQTAALEIMEQMALYQETALEKLYRWTQSHCRNIELAETSLLLTQAMTYLQNRPILFKYVMDEYCTSRRSVLVRAFLDALTQGGPGGMPKPIELHAHDPKRYVGDMLAWLHQTIPSEKENLLTLLKGCDKIDVLEQVQEALSNITEGVCHPMKVRIEHILASEMKPTVLYGITNLVRFYHQVIGQVVSGGTLITTLEDLQELSQSTFLSVLELEVKQHLGVQVDGTTVSPSNLTPPTDLAPPPAIARLLGILKEVLAVANVAEGRAEDLTKVVSCVMNPLLQAVNESAARLPSVDMAVYLLNCMYSMHTTLSLYEFVDERLERLQAQSDAQLDTLASEQASSLVANLNLGPIYTILQDPNRGSLSSIPGMEPNSLKNFLNKLEGFLVVPDALVLPQMNLLLSSNHRITTQRRAFEVIVTVYQQLYDAVHDPANGYQHPDLLMTRSPQEVTHILMNS